jgi:ER membrane protein complex subunit 2
VSTQNKKDSVGAGKLPSLATVQKLDEIATKKLGEIIRRSASGEKGWDGFYRSELIAARELLDRDTKDVQR